MEIIRKVFYGTSYEGLYRLIKNCMDEYEWIYINDTTGNHINPDQLDYPILNVEEGRRNKMRPGKYLLNTHFYLEPQDLEDGNCLEG